MNTTSSSRLATAALVAAILLALPAGAQNGGRTLPNGVFVSDPVVPFVLDVDLRTVPPAPAWQPGDPIEVVPELVWSDGPTERIEGWQDPVRQETGPLFSGSLLFAVEAHPPPNSNPPDTVGSVGPNHYISMVNASRFAIWDKDGNNLVPPTILNTLWGGGASPCEDGDGDPIVEYDDFADRFLMSEFDITGNTFCIYISQGPDPVTDGWYSYAFSAPVFPDYPQYGVWPDAYYVGSFESPNLGIYAFDRLSMLDGLPATFQRFAIPHLNGPSPRVTRILPGDFDGPNPPPAGEPNPFVRSVHATQDNTNPTTRLELWEYHVDFATPPNSTFTLEQTLIPAPFALLPCAPGVRDCVPQPATNNLIDALFNRALRRLHYRVDAGGAETLVTNQVVDVGGGVGGTRWWELRRDPLSLGAGWTLRQDSTYSPDETYRFMGSIAMNGDGDIALGYSASSETVFPAIRVTARRAEDPLNQMTMEELTLVPGVASMTASQRWGDYTSMDVDPTDDRTFWYVNQRLNATNQRSVWIGKFSLDQIFADGFESGDTSAWSNTVP
ncbi:MAG: hypothetical protein OEP45_14445 [Acidobacteriota bacterium]|nr:hypothetical protein [Acidobacteriota bacterium]